MTTISKPDTAGFAIPDDGGEDEKPAHGKSPVTEDEWIIGSVEAPVTLLEYGDFQCPYCAAARPAVEALVEDHADRFRLVYRHFPVVHRHPNALLAAEAAEAAGVQDRFWEMHDALYTHQDDLEFDGLRDRAEEIGLDLARFADELRAHEWLAQVKRDFRMGLLDGVRSTPTIFINGYRYDGPRTRAAIVAAIDSKVIESAQSEASRI